jgi:GTP pyrophosphokinase
MGHRCRGAKINGHIVPLTHVLQSGDKIEIITAPQGQSGPSRDWLNAELGYIKTASARKKIALWFRELTYADDVIAGRQTLERELIRLGITKTIALSTIARQLHFKNEDDLLAALNHGRIKLMRLMQLIHPKRVEKSPVVVQQITAKTVTPSRENLIGNADLLTRLAQCCKPVVGDDIVGYISRRGLAIHKKNCVNLQHLSKERFIPIYWNADEKK